MQKVRCRADRGTGIADRALGPQIDLLICGRAPEAFGHTIVAPRAPAVSVAMVGLIDGIAEATASITKVFTGYL